MLSVIIKNKKTPEFKDTFRKHVYLDFLSKNGHQDANIMSLSQRGGEIFPSHDYSRGIVELGCDPTPRKHSLLPSSRRKPGQNWSRCRIDSIVCVQRVKSEWGVTKSNTEMAETVLRVSPTLSIRWQRSQRWIYTQHGWQLNHLSFKLPRRCKCVRVNLR